jgi:hypothetical protein
VNIVVVYSMCVGNSDYIAANGGVDAEWEGFGRKCSWPNQGTIPAFARRV